MIDASDPSQIFHTRGRNRQALQLVLTFWQANGNGPFTPIMYVCQSSSHYKRVPNSQIFLDHVHGRVLQSCQSRPRLRMSVTMSVVLREVRPRMLKLVEVLMRCLFELRGTGILEPRGVCEDCIGTFG
jgi:hypothetical protein